MKIDLHVHASERSACSNAREEDQIRAAIRKGLDGLVFTDHHRLVPKEQLAFLNKKYAPFRIFGGVEITVEEGEDFLVLGIHETSLERWYWSHEELNAFVRQRNGWMALAHPYRFRQNINVDIERMPPDAVEICSHNVRKDLQERIRQLAQKIDVPVVSNSDSHAVRTSGQYYNVFPHPIKHQEELIMHLKMRDFHCSCFDRIR